MLLDNDSGFEEMLFRAMGVPVAHGNRYAVVPFLRRWAQAKGMRLVELGTEQGNRQLFRLDRLPERETGWLAEHLGGAEEQLVIARFSPEELPLVVVPDRDAELKRRLEDDEADKRISTAALRLARQFTRSSTIASRAGSTSTSTIRRCGRCSRPSARNATKRPMRRCCCARSK